MNNEQFEIFMAKLEEIRVAINPPQCKAPECMKNCAGWADGFCDHHHQMANRVKSLGECQNIRQDINSDSYLQIERRIGDMERELGY